MSRIIASWGGVLAGDHFAVELMSDHFPHPGDPWVETGLNGEGEECFLIKTSKLDRVQDVHSAKSICLNVVRDAQNAILIVGGEKLAKWQNLNLDITSVMCYYEDGSAEERRPASSCCRLVYSLEPDRLVPHRFSGDGINEFKIKSITCITFTQAIFALWANSDQKTLKMREILELCRDAEPYKLYIALEIMQELVKGNFGACDGIAEKRLKDLKTSMNKYRHYKTPPFPNPETPENTLLDIREFIRVWAENLVSLESKLQELS